MREPILESDKYQLFMSGKVRKGGAWGGEYDSSRQETYRREGDAVILDKTTGERTQFRYSTDTERGSDGLWNDREVILRTSLMTRDERLGARRVQADQACLKDKLPEVTDLICNDLLRRINKDPDPIKFVRIGVISYLDLLQKGLVADSNDQIPLLVT